METINSKTAAFHGSNAVNPEQLITFSTAYLEKLPELKKFINDHKRRKVYLPFVRVGPNGEVTYKTLLGFIKFADDNHFIFLTEESFYGSGIYEDGLRIEVRFDNVLGMVPLHPDYPSLDPFSNKDSGAFSGYLPSLMEMRNLLKECLGVPHGVTMYFKLKDDKGMQRVEAKITEVNKSNIRYDCMRSVRIEPGASSFSEVTLGVGDTFARFITPDCYLQKVLVNFGDNSQMNIYDDGD